MENKQTFSSSTLHLWPFGGHKLWRGFIEKHLVTISDTDIVIESGTFSKTYPIKDLEFCIKKNRWFRMGNPKVIVGTEWKDGPWEGASVQSEYLYVDKNEYDNFIDAVKSKKPICFSDDSAYIETSAAWYRIDKIITGNRNSLWLNPQHIISSEGIGHCWCVNTKDIKYFFTRGLFFNNLYIGSEKNIRLENVNKSNIKTAQKYINSHGGNIAEEAAESYKDWWTPNVLFNPSLWFTHSSIGFTEEGIVYKQKTFKTNDNIFLPYKKVNMAIYESKWYWLFTKDVTIFGEQNIMPRRRYSKFAVKAIKGKLQEKGVNTLKGTKYTPSYHSSWFGILLCIVTLSLYHWFVVGISFLKKKNIIIIGESKISWNGKIYGFTADKEDSFDRKEMKNLTTLVLDGEELRSVVYIKKHWYHLWGYIFIWAHPWNIRVSEAEASQHTVDYDLEIYKIWSWNASSVKKNLESAGWERDSATDKFYKKWAKIRLLGD